MGLLSQGKPLDWDETKKYAKYVQERGITQFINIYNKSKHRADGPFKWGDEVEYVLVKFDHEQRKAKVNIKAEEVFQKLEEQHKSNPGAVKTCWHPEFGAYMVEGTPALPYGINGLLLASLCDVEENMAHRRREVQRVLNCDESVLSITNFPRLGCPEFTYPVHHPKPETSVSRSIFWPDEAIFGGHPRFKTLHQNIVSRRGRRIAINYPIYRDVRTPSPSIELFNDLEAQQASKPNHILMDSMGFGMGCCCLQVTFQATHIEEAKVLYDQLTPLAPIGLALSAGSPVYRGYLTDRDCRWAAISSAVDDRTPEESGEGLEGLKETRCRIPKSRYDSVSLYLSRQGQKYNDLPLVYDKNYYDIMVAHEVDPAIARHVAHLFIRDPISVYKEKLEQTDDDLDHFENIQSTNWQTMRFKPPPAVHSPIGWRVEYRPFEVQTTDFENAAYVTFVTLLTRVILAYKLNFLLPLTLVDENMIEAQKRDAIKNSRFWFRHDIIMNKRESSSKEPLGTVLENCTNSSNACNRPSFRNGTNNSNKTLSVDDVESYASLMTINEIINGCETFIGLMPIICHYVGSFNDGSNKELISKINRYLKLISDRASLKVKTTARFMRDFIGSHPNYEHDSVVNDQVNYDLMKMMDKIGKGEVMCPELTGNLRATTADNWSMNTNFCLNCSIRQHREAAMSIRNSPNRNNQTTMPKLNQQQSSSTMSNNNSNSNNTSNAINRRSSPSSSPSPSSSSSSSSRKFASGRQGINNRLDSEKTTSADPYNSRSFSR